jgi:hypothetical protein
VRNEKDIEHALHAHARETVRGRDTLEEKKRARKGREREMETI